MYKSRIHCIVWTIVISLCLLAVGCDSSNPIKSDQMPYPPEGVLGLPFLDDGQLGVRICWLPNESKEYRVYQSVDGHSPSLIEIVIVGDTNNNPGVGNSKIDPSPDVDEDTDNTQYQEVAAIFWGLDDRTFEIYVTSVQNGQESPPSSSIRFIPSAFAPTAGIDLLSPDPSAPQLDSVVSFCWAGLAGCTDYFLAISGNSSSSEPIWLHRDSSTCRDIFAEFGISYFSRGKELEPGQYSWQVWSINQNNFGELTSSSSFKL